MNAESVKNAVSGTAPAASPAGQSDFELGCLAIANGQLDEGIASLLAAVSREPDEVAIAHALGVAYRLADDAENSLSWASRAVTLDPGDQLSWEDLAAAAAQFREWDEVARACAAWVRLAPDASDAWQLWAQSLRSRKKYRGSLAILVTGWRKNRRNATLAAAIGTLYAETGNCGRGIWFLRQAVDLDPSFGEAWSNLLFTMTCHDALSPAAVSNEHRRFGERYPPVPAIAQPRRKRNAQPARIRVGYISADFRRHPSERFNEPVFAAHDRREFELFAYSGCGQGDASTIRYRSHFENWRDITQMTDDQVLKQIAGDRLDILVDHSGHCSHNRLSVFGRRPAPVQITHCAYPNTTGLSQMDWLLTDSVVDPEGFSEDHFTERLLRVDPCFLCFAAPLIAVSPQYSGPDGAPVTFGTCNPIRKFSASTLDLWARILAAVPHSRLFLKAWAFNDPAVICRLTARFERRGISPERIQCRPFDNDEYAYLATYSEIDISLDPFPYNGTTTTCEALWMGVPVVTKPGDTHAARVGASLLSAAQCSEWVADSEESYLAIAVRLASDIRRLRRSRAAQREHLLSTPLMDTRTFTRRYESALTSCLR